MVTGAVSSADVGSVNNARRVGSLEPGAPVLCFLIFFRSQSPRFSQLEAAPEKRGAGRPADARSCV